MEIATPDVVDQVCKHSACMGPFFLFLCVDDRSKLPHHRILILNIEGKSPQYLAHNPPFHRVPILNVQRKHPHTRHTTCQCPVLPFCRQVLRLPTCRQVSRLPIHFRRHHLKSFPAIVIFSSVPGSGAAEAKELANTAWAATIIYRD